MIQKVRNVIEIRCPDVDFTDGTDMEVYVVQDVKRLIYPLTAKTEHTATFEIPKEDAMKFKKGTVKMQFAITVDSAPIVSKVIEIPVEELLRSDGYGD